MPPDVRVRPLPEIQLWFLASYPHLDMPPLRTNPADLSRDLTPALPRHARASIAVAELEITVPQLLDRSAPHNTPTGHYSFAFRETCRMVV